MWNDYLRNFTNGKKRQGHSRHFDLGKFSVRIGKYLRFIHQRATASRRKFSNQPRKIKPKAKRKGKSRAVEIQSQLPIGSDNNLIMPDRVTEYGSATEPTTVQEFAEFSRGQFTEIGSDE